ncbi:hypothetical protein N7539_006573 [Penicillium diatomitis]|uniref:GPI anchored protein n=1 Tax=Penicillium diatomitis TaxID=2819901 RepID=A0A9X0BS28_9EURO|nr:uncharacterized protein N7539_006573 [Penicillium diatomitis]KAJ5480679.1 hypothetical protein N7539_006573 [Penicillium diatomitis]
MSFKSCIALLATVGVATAQSSVVSLFMPDTDPQPLAASIVGQSSGKVTYSINCPAGTDPTNCGMGPGMLYTSAPNDIEWSIVEPSDDFTARIVCSMGGTTTAKCTEMMGGSAANFPGTSTLDLAQSQITYLPVTVTAGAITAGDSTTTATASATSTISKASSAAPSTVSKASGAASSTSTGGLPRITGNPRAVLGGAAAALIAAAL